MTMDSEDIWTETAGAETTNFYELLGVERNASGAVIKKAYYKKCLVLHPDKVLRGATDEAERAAATAAFQRLTHAHTVLADPARRRHYDATGRDPGLDGMDALSAHEPPPGGWAAFFTTLWGGLVSSNAIDAFALQYRGSDQEARDVVDAYMKAATAASVAASSAAIANPSKRKRVPSNSNNNISSTNINSPMDRVLAAVPLAVWSDEDRFRAIVQAAIDKGDVSMRLDPFFQTDPKATARRKRCAEREEAQLAALSSSNPQPSSSKAISSSSTVSKRATRSSSSSSNSNIPTNDDDTATAALEAQLKERNKNRMASLIDKLESKASASKITSKSTSKNTTNNKDSNKDKSTRGIATNSKKSSTAQTKKNNHVEEPSEQEFLALQEKLFKKSKNASESNNTTASSASKARNKVPQEVVEDKKEVNDDNDDGWSDEEVDGDAEDLSKDFTSNQIDEDDGESIDDDDDEDEIDEIDEIDEVVQDASLKRHK
ncbi:hypothetical protein HK100_000217 [Physocladia obscura]|uniref:J domain-containing protein n=1 Tax=Physocladia obscura TaxID=109957 RepID=A0AAD5XCP0_9FUNG|nr:hypothetical protein HK100_000217 [Physocladia obscura]